MPSLFSLRELIFPENFPDAFPHNSPVPSEHGAGTALERLQRPGQVAPALAAFAVSTTVGLRSGKREQQVVKTDPGDHGWQCQLRSLAATTTSFRAAGAAGAWVPERASLVSAGERRCGGAGGRDRDSGALLPLASLWQHFAQGWEAGRTARLQLGSPPARLLSFAGSKGVLCRDKRVGGPGYPRKETAHKGWRETNIRKVTPPSCGVKSGVFCLLCMSCSALSPDPDEGSQGYLVLGGR